MEQHNISGLQNLVHMFSLQYVFAGRIQRTLSNWTQAHNMHDIRTENYINPYSIMVSRYSYLMGIEICEIFFQ